MHLRLQAIGLAGDQSFELPITQVELADTVGLSVVHVNRSLKSLRASGVITFRSGRVVILDHAGLREMCDFRSNYLHLEKSSQNVFA